MTIGDIVKWIDESLLAIVNPPLYLWPLSPRIEDSDALLAALASRNIYPTMEPACLRYFTRLPANGFGLFLQPQDRYGTARLLPELEEAARQCREGGRMPKVIWIDYDLARDKAWFGLRYYRGLRRTLLRMFPDVLVFCYWCTIDGSCFPSEVHRAFSDAPWPDLRYTNDPDLVVELAQKIYDASNGALLAPWICLTGAWVGAPGRFSELRFGLKSVGPEEWRTLGNWWRNNRQITCGLLCEYTHMGKCNGVVSIPV